MRGYVSIKRAAEFLPRFIGGYFCRTRFIPRQIPRLSIETTNFCDCRCVFCANKLMRRKREHLDMALFKKAIDEFAAWGVGDIDFNSTIGEPLLDPYLLERARYVRSFEQNKILGFVTNLQWLQKFDLAEFFDSGITWLCLSITLSGRQKYKEFFGVDRYDTVLENMVKLIKENKRRLNPMVIHLSLKPTNEDTEAILGHPDLKMIASLLNRDIEKLARERTRYVDDWTGAVKLPAYLEKRPRYPRFFRPCALFYAGLMLFSNGRIGVCHCRDYEADSALILGNIKDNSIKSLWESGQLKRLRLNWRVKNMVPDICNRCDHYVY